MDEKEKSSEIIGNICTILGGALLFYPLIESATKTIIPEMQKLQSGETLEQLKMLPSGEEKQPKEKPEQWEQERETERKSHSDEVTELKRKLAELEGKSDERKSEE